MQVAITQQRQTKYCQAIEHALKIHGHATNAEILEYLRKTFPTLSATTVHRATTRLAERGVIAAAPVANDGSMRYDANTKPHDHFQCHKCDLLRDTSVKDKIIPILEQSINGCSVSGQLTISGICKKCIEEKA